jgi:acid phosphatase type 7
MRGALALLAAAATARSARAAAYDFLAPWATPPAECTTGCAPWTGVAASGNPTPQATINALWANASALANAGTTCAMPANFDAP